MINNLCLMLHSQNESTKLINIPINNMKTDAILWHWKQETTHNHLRSASIMKRNAWRETKYRTVMSI
jgi:hypothetical protein